MSNNTAKQCRGKSSRTGERCLKTCAPGSKHCAWHGESKAAAVEVADASLIVSNLLGHKEESVKDISEFGSFWMRMSTYKQLRAATLLFLNGMLGGSVWHNGPLDPETVAVVDELRQINALGFLTTHGQPGKSECHEAKFNDYTQEYLALRQREDVHGLFPAKLADLFIDDLVRHGLIVLQKRYSSNGQTENRTFAYWSKEKMGEIPLEQYATTMGWTDSKEGDTPEETDLLDWSENDPDTELRVAQGESDDLSVARVTCQRGLSRWMNSNLVELRISASDYCQEGMLTTVLKCLKKLAPQMAVLPEMCEFRAKYI